MWSCCKVGRSTTFDHIFVLNIFADITAHFSAKGTYSLSASPYTNPRLTICYRTMPHAHEDGRHRPDLRLGGSDPCVKKVATVVRWFENMAGIAAH